MKILFVNTSDTNGGAARAAMRIMDGVRSIGVDAQMFVKTSSSAQSSVISIDEYRPQTKLFVCLDWLVSKVKNKWQHFIWYPYHHTKKPLYMSDLRSIRTFGVLRRQHYDILHLHWINGRFIDIGELKYVGRPIVWTLHDSWPFCGVCHVFYDCDKYKTHCAECPMLGSVSEHDLAHRVFKSKRRAYMGTDLHIVAPSTWLASCAKNSALLGRFSVTVIPNCIDTLLFTPLPKHEACRFLDLESHKTYILYGAMQATADPNKGFDELCKALVLLNTEMNNINLLVFGSDESYDNLHLPVPGRMIGFVADDQKMVNLYNAADIVVVPSLSENLSNTIMESLSCGTPVCCFDIGGNSDMVDHQKNGYLAREKDCRDLADGIKWCLENNKSDELGRAARQKVLDNFTPEKVSRQYFELYNEIMQKNHRTL